MASGSESHQLHFVLIPLMCPGHQNPMVDIGKLLAQQGVIITIVTTPRNAFRFNSVINRTVESGLPIRLLQLRFPALEVGLPEGCENMDLLPSRDLGTVSKFFSATSLLQKPLEMLLYDLQPSPSCMISDRYLPWTVNIARKFRIPRILFDGTSCFSMVCSHKISISKVLEGMPDSQPLSVPGLPDHIEFTRSQLPVDLNPGSEHIKDMHKGMEEAEKEDYGLIVNTFEELEKEYAKESRKLKDNKIWCIGPVSLCNKEELDKAQRGNDKASICEDLCLKWLDSRAPSSVIYACLGTISCLTSQQLIELGLGLEASNRPFIWVITGGANTEEIKKWTIDQGFEERIKGRGLLIWGWAPQLLILSHKAVGGFLTHCGWNSTLEAVCAGMPMITWPISTDQFFNEKFVVQVLRIGVRVGAEVAMKWGEEESFSFVIKREEVKKAINELMDVGEKGEERRQRAIELGKMAKKAMEEGGSSYLSLTLLIQDIMQQAAANQT